MRARWKIIQRDGGFRLEWLDDDGLWRALGPVYRTRGDAEADIKTRRAASGPKPEWYYSVDGTPMDRPNINIVRGFVTLGGMFAALCACGAFIALVVRWSFYR